MSNTYFNFHDTWIIWAMHGLLSNDAWEQRFLNKSRFYKSKTKKFGNDSSIHLTPIKFAFQRKNHCPPVVSATPQWVSELKNMWESHVRLFKWTSNGHQTFQVEESSPEKARSMEDLVGGWTNPFEKHSSKWESSPNRDEQKKYLKPSPRYVFLAFRPLKWWNPKYINKVYKSRKPRKNSIAGKTQQSQ